MATVYNDTIFGQKVLQQLNTLLFPLKAFTTDISDELVKPGSAVVVPLYGNVTSTTFTQSTTVMEGTGGLISAVTVTLDKRKIAPIDLTHQQLLESTAAGRHDRFTGQLAKSMANMVLTDILKVVTTVTFGEASATTSSSVWALARLNAIRANLKTAGVPAGERSVVMNDLCETALLGDTNLVLALNRGSTTSINEGEIGRVMGLDLYASGVFPTNSISMNAFACGKDAVAVAFRRISEELPDGEFEAMEEFIDDETGLSLLLTRHWSRAQAKWFINMHCLYGYSAAVTTALKIYCTATT